MVGGASRSDHVQKRVADHTGLVPSVDIDPSLAIVFGGVYAGLAEKARRNEDVRRKKVLIPAPDIFVRDVTAYSVGCAVLKEAGSRDLINAEIIPKNTPIPSIQTRTFKMAEPKQTAVRIQVLDGEEGADVNKCMQLGHFDLRDLPARPDLIGRIEITFHLDANGMLTSTARDTVSGKTAELKIDYKKATRSKQDQQAKATI